MDKTILFEFVNGFLYTNQQDLPRNGKYRIKLKNPNKDTHFVISDLNKIISASGYTKKVQEIKDIGLDELSLQYRYISTEYPQGMEPLNSTTPLYEVISERQTQLLFKDKVDKDNFMRLVNILIKDYYQRQ